jgi:hypothetical protein
MLTSKYAGEISTVFSNTERNELRLECLKIKSFYDTCGLYLLVTDGIPIILFASLYRLI